MALSTRLPCPTSVVLPGPVVNAIHADNSAALDDWTGVGAPKDQIEYAFELAATEGRGRSAAVLIQVDGISLESKARALEAAIMCEKIYTIQVLVSYGAPATLGAWKMAAYRDDATIIQCLLGVVSPASTYDPPVFTGGARSYLDLYQIRRLFLRYKATRCLSLLDLFERGGPDNSL